MCSGVPNKILAVMLIKAVAFDFGHTLVDEQKRSVRPAACTASSPDARCVGGIAAHTDSDGSLGEHVPLQEQTFGSISKEPAWAGSLCRA